MSADDTQAWRDAIALYEAIRDLPEDQQASRLASVGEDVRSRVARMRAASERRGPLDQPLPATHPPARLGRWEVRELLGRGGMSEVYRGHSLAAPLGQAAALKLLAVPAPGAEVIGRFSRETEILVRLQHPGIASLLDAGVADDGRPWFAMALVAGELIDAWCEHRQLSLRQRVQLVAQVADAAAHAHRHLVVHRDIKPGNVMVDAEGRAVLLDFGISRVLEEGAAELTAGGSYPFTPRYAAPEQREGGAISTATDVFGLGALLYRLLLDVAPTLAPGAGLMLPAGAKLPVDLEAILRKSLARAPEDRYPGAAEFSADLSAWLAGRPVQARRGGRAYRFRRWLSRNPALSALSVALVASLLVGSGISLWQAREAQRQAESARAAQAQAEAARAQAESALARAGVVRDYVANIFASSDPGRGADTTASELLSAGAALVDDALVAERPEVAVDLLRLIGGARSARGEFQASKASFERGLAILAEHPGVERRLRWQLLHEFAGTLHTRGDNARAIALLTEALALADADHATAQERILVEVQLATAESAAGDNARAAERLARLRPQVEASDVRGTRLHLKLLETLSTVNALLRLPDDRALFEERLQVADQVYADSPGWRVFTQADAIPTLRRWRDYARAQQLADSAVALADELYAEPNVIAAIAYCNAGGLALERGDLVQARRLLDRAIAIDGQLARNHVHALSCLLNRAEVRAGLADAGGARADIAAAEVMRKVLGMGEDSRWHALACALQVRMALRNDDTTAAAASLAVCADASGGDSPLGIEQAALALRQGDTDAAAAWLAEPGQPHPADGPAGLRHWRLRLVLLDATDPDAARSLRPRLLEAAGRIPEPWFLREPTLACLAATGLAQGCAGLP
jgi:tetratricopeptide (TPR) repeat protein